MIENDYTEHKNQTCSFNQPTMFPKVVKQFSFGYPKFRIRIRIQFDMSHQPHSTLEDADGQASFVHDVDLKMLKDVPLLDATHAGIFGDCDKICPKCFAYFWYDKRVLRDSTVAVPVYNQCCKQGYVVLPFPKQPPPLLDELFSTSSFLDNVCAYNSILCPQPATNPRFLQLYIYDTTNEIDNRMRFYDSSEGCSLDHEVVSQIAGLLPSINEYIRLFKTSKELSKAMNLEDFSIRLYNNDPDRIALPPHPGTLGGIVFGDDINANEYDIVVHSRDGNPKRVVSGIQHVKVEFHANLMREYERAWRFQLYLKYNSNNPNLKSRIQIPNRRNHLHCFTR
ncbi:hypothetical protein LXL04_007535 [Taraxacum kok-saghyz]